MPDELPDQLPEPSDQLGDPVDLLIGYLDAYRAAAVRKVEGLDERQLRSSVLPSGWTPLELLRHLAAMERRWIQWGFRGIPLSDPYPDRDLTAHRWLVPDDVGLDRIRAELDDAAAHTHAVLAEQPGRDLAVRGRLGGNFTSAPAPSLGWILFHILQEYARHVGHLDIVRELIDGRTGE